MNSWQIKCYLHFYSSNSHWHGCYTAPSAPPSIVALKHSVPVTSSPGQIRSSSDPSSSASWFIVICKYSIDFPVIQWYSYCDLTHGVCSVNNVLWTLAMPYKSTNNIVGLQSYYDRLHSVPLGPTRHWGPWIVTIQHIAPSSRPAYFCYDVSSSSGP